MSFIGEGLLFAIVRMSSSSFLIFVNAHNNMPESRLLTKRGNKFTEKAIKHEVVEKKEETKYPVGPWAMAFFAFVIVGSTLFQFISMWYSR